MRPFEYREPHELICPKCGKKFLTRKPHQKQCHECWLKEKPKNRCERCGRKISPNHPVKICSFCEELERKVNRERKEFYPPICQRCGKPIIHMTCDCSIEGKKPLRA